MLIRYSIILLLFNIACKKEPSLFKPAEITPDYVLPQGKSPADPRIVDIYKKYDAYFLYDFRDADFWYYYEYIAQNSKSTYYYTKSDPQSAGLILDFLDSAFFKFYTPDFVKSKIKLYKVMLVDTLKFRTSTSTDWSAVNELVYARLVVFPGGSTQLALGRVAPRLANYTAAMKTTYKNSLNQAIWQSIGSNFGNDVPPAFTALSDYSKVASTDVNSADYYLRRGFYNLSMISAANLNPQTDLANYISTLATKSVTDLQADWIKYPLLKQKYDIVNNLLITKYGVNVPAIFAYQF